MNPLFRNVLLLLCLLAAGLAQAGETILIFGDSLSAGYGLARDQSWPSLLATKLANDPAYQRYTVVNASISGETTAGGQTRLEPELKRHAPKVVVFELGANDGLRGLPVAQMTTNLATMVRAAKKAGARVLVIGMQLPPNYGVGYTRDFEQAFATVAKQEKTGLLPFLLAPVAADSTAFQADGLHPVASAQPKILDHVWQALLPLLKPGK